MSIHITEFRVVGVTESSWRRLIASPLRTNRSPRAHQLGHDDNIMIDTLSSRYNFEFSGRENFHCFVLALADEIKPNDNFMVRIINQFARLDLEFESIRILVNRYGHDQEDGFWLHEPLDKFLRLWKELSQIKGIFGDTGQTVQLSIELMKCLGVNTRGIRYLETLNYLVRY